MPFSTIDSAAMPESDDVALLNDPESNESENFQPEDGSQEPDDDSSSGNPNAAAVDTQQTTGASNARGLLHASQKEEKARKLAYILSVPPSSIVLSEDGSGDFHISHIGTAVYNRDITINMHRQYCKKHNITVGNARTRDMLEKRIISHINAGPLKEALSSNRRKTSGSDRVLPAWCKKIGTILRLINVITCQAGRPHYMSLKDALDRAMLDSGVAHPQAFEALRSLHNTRDNEDENVELTYNFEELQDRLDPCQSQDFEDLSIDQLKELLAYIEFWYKRAHGKMKGVSGNNSNDFGAYCKDKDWVFYFHLKMKMLDPTMLSHVVSQLPSHIFNESNRAGASGTRVPHSGSSGKATSVLSVRGAADAIKDRQGDANRAENLERLQKYEDDLADKQQRKADLDKQFFAMKAERKRDVDAGFDYDDEVGYAALENQCRAVKKRVVRLQGEIKTIKDKLGYYNEASDDEGSYNG